MSSLPAAPRPDGLEALFLAHRSALVRFVRARGAHDDAEDVVQDLWSRASAARSGPVADPVAYLYRMADNLMIDRMRANIRRRRREDEWSQSLAAGGDDGMGQPSAERGVIARQHLRMIELRLAALGERTLAIFRAYRLDGLGQKEIAVRHGISLSAVEKHLQKAYRALLAIQREEDADVAVEHRLGLEGAVDE